MGRGASTGVPYPCALLSPETTHHTFIYIKKGKIRRQLGFSLLPYMIILLTLQREIKKTFPPTKRWQRKAKSSLLGYAECSRYSTKLIAKEEDNSQTITLRERNRTYEKAYHHDNCSSDAPVIMRHIYRPRCRFRKHNRLCCRRPCWWTTSL